MRTEEGELSRVILYCHASRCENAQHDGYQQQGRYITQEMATVHRVDDGLHRQ